MTRVTKSDLLKENEKLKNILAQIHNLTSSLNGSEPSNIVNVVELVSTDEQKPMATRASKRNLSAPKGNSLPVSGNGKKVKQRKSASDKKTKIEIVNISDEVDKSTSEDLLEYLRLQKSAPSTPISDDRRQKSNSTPAIAEQGKSTARQTAKLEPAHLVTVVLDRLNPADIVKACRQPSVKKRPSNRPEPRRSKRKHTSSTIQAFKLGLLA